MELALDRAHFLDQRRAVTPEPGERREGESLVIAAARRGDRAAFEQLYDRYARLVHGILLARLPHTEVEDLAQEVFLLVFRKLSSLRDPDSFGSWIAQIARNRASDFHRRAVRTEELPESLTAPECSDSEAADALEAIRNLPEAYRETLVLRLVEGLNGPEIAARTGLTPGSVRVNLHRGMALLREKLRLPNG